MRNVVMVTLLLPGTRSLPHWADDYVGFTKMFDSDKYFSPRLILAG